MLLSAFLLVHEFRQDRRCTIITLVHTPTHTSGLSNAASVWRRITLFPHFAETLEALQVSFRSRRGLVVFLVTRVFSKQAGLTHTEKTTCVA